MATRSTIPTPDSTDTAPDFLARMAVANAQSLGTFGADRYADTSAHTGTWGVIQVTSDCVFTTLTAANLGGTWTGVTFTAGTILYGRFTAITLTSGVVVAYRSA